MILERKTLVSNQEILSNRHLLSRADLFNQAIYWEMETNRDRTRRDVADIQTRNLEPRKWRKKWVHTFIFFVAGFFLTIYKLKSKDVSKKGQSISLNQNFIINIFENAVGYLQEIIIYDLKKIFLNSLADASKKNASYISKIRSTSMLPRVYLETFFIVAAILFIFFSNLTAISIQENIAFLAILAYGIQKTLPQINSIYSLTINFKSVKPII